MLSEDLRAESPTLLYSTHGDLLSRPIERAVHKTMNDCAVREFTSGSIARSGHLVLLTKVLQTPLMTPEAGPR